MLRKLKHRFILITMLLVSIVLSLVFISIYAVAYRRGRNQIIIELNNISAEIVGDEDMLINQPPKEQGFLFKNQSFSFTTFTVIFNYDMTPEKVYYGKSPTSYTSDIDTAVNAIISSNETEGILSKNDLIFCRIENAGKFIITFTTLDTLLILTALGTYSSAIVLICGLLLCFLLVWALAGIAMRPVEKAWEREKQFVADASHDLKTPLTIILANTEIVKSKSDNACNDISVWLDSTKEEAERMKRLVESMLELAKSESLSSKIPTYKVNISELCEQVSLQMEPIAFEKNVSLKAVIENNIIIESNSDYFNRLAHILIDNAIKYASENTYVLISLKRQKREVKLSVFNQGSYIPEEHIPHLFERFWRSDKVRTQDSFGLGLAIAKNICENLGGKISVSSDKESGTEFTATFSK